MMQISLMKEQIHQQISSFSTTFHTQISNELFLPTEDEGLSSSQVRNND